MTYLLIILLGTQFCTASVFGYRGDELAGGAAPGLSRPVRATDDGVAHRWLPIGSRVLVHNPRTSRSHVTTVIDRGPFGLLGKRWRNGAKMWRRAHRAAARSGRRRGLAGLELRRWVRRHVQKLEDGRWRGCVDLTRHVQRKLNHNGLEPVWVVPLGD